MAPLDEQVPGAVGAERGPVISAIIRRQGCLMRPFLMAAFVSVFGTSGVPLSSDASPATRITIIAAGRDKGATFAVDRNEFYINGPMATVGLPPVLDASEARPLTFSTRAWKEGRKTRVVVYARLRDERAPEGATETAIDTFFMNVGETREIPEAAKWGDWRVTIIAARP